MHSSEVPGLAGRLVALEPLHWDHVDDLAEAADEDRASFSFTSVPTSRTELEAQVGTLIAERVAGTAVPFVQRRLQDRHVVGMTRFLALRLLPGSTTPYAVEIGGTWLAASAQRTGINVEAKLLLLTFAFETWLVGRVDFKTDARNARSRAALAGLGATFEGVLRSWQPSHALGETDQLRDSAMYSITAHEWADVRAGLETRLRR